ncbi:MAG TPA: MBG domain-containing protein, partial [Candidatus Methylomirabilis sp.]|nr:MBG domain-containing protein [Candidatus Methylomirabilis sp.]
MSDPIASCFTTRRRRRPVADGALRHGLALLLVCLVSAWTSPAQAQVPFSPGDLVIGLGSSPDGTPEGKLRHFAPDGTLLDTLLTTSGSFEETGPCFDAAHALYTTNFEANSMSKFAPSGALLLSSFGSGFNQSPNSCVLDAAGNLYVGLADKDGNFGGGGALKLDAAGDVLATFPDIAPDARGTDWIDLAADQCTLYYTSVGASIKRYDLCQHAQLPDFCTACADGAGGATAGTFFALRLLPDGSLLVADWNFAGNSGLVRRYLPGPDSTATQVMAYTTTDALGAQCGPDFAQPCFFPWALALDPDGTSFWAADNISGEIFRFDLAGGTVLTSFQGGDCSDAVSSCAVTGLAIVGEPTAAAAAPSATPSVTATITAANKVYDGTVAATITSCTLTGVHGTDDVSCLPSAGAFASPGVGTGKAVSATVTLVGTAAGSYTLASPSASTTANITPAPASVTPNAATKTYGAADPAFSGTLTGFIASDNVTATYSRTAGESVAGSPYSISATLSPAAVLANYTVTYNTAAFMINKATASVTPSAASKTYGAADPTLTGALSGFISSDGVTATYSRTAGESVAGSPYTISATLSPAAVLANYTVTYNTAGFTISKATASVSPSTASKTYGAPDPVFTGTLTGFIASDNITATYSRTAGESVAGSPYSISATLSPA